MAEAVDLSMTPPSAESSDAVGDTFLPAFESSLSESGPLESSDELLDEDEDEDDNLFVGEGLDAVACFGAVKEGDSARDVEAEIGCDASGGKIVGDTGGGAIALDGGFDDFTGEVFCGFCFCLLVCNLDSSSEASDAEAGVVVAIVVVAALEQVCFVFFFFFFKLFLI